MNELKSNPKRQAIHTLNGYSYQIWQSLLRWVSLGESEGLFLEGAEDIDRHGPSGVETIAVKETAASGSLTLRSTDILEAIANFWQHQQQNPEIKITFRFLTTAERGREQSNPFGKMKGLDLWDRCKYPSSDLHSLREFLSERQCFPESLRDFIATAADEQLRQCLLIPIEWDTRNKPQPFVEDAVRRKVSGYGDRVFDLQHSESIKAIPQLLQHVFDTARQKGNRWLDTTDFRRMFEEAITERVTRSELQSLRRAAASPAQFGIQSEGVGVGGAGRIRLAQSTGSVLEVLKPPHNERLVQRTQLVRELLDTLNTEGLLVLKGSTGMGKSTLANAVAMSGTGNWRWLDMRGVEPEQVKDRLLYAAHLIEDKREQTDCIVDDLNFDRRPDIYENALARLIYAVKLNNGRLIVTTQGTLPSRIVGLYDITTDSFIDVPLLSEQEVMELVSNHSCPAGSRLDGWSRIVYSSTQGHPLLAHARVRSQEAGGWSVPTFDDLLASTGIDEIRREIRQRLRDQLASDDARTLLYRLSIFTRRFERQQALYLGTLAPQVRLSGEAFDLLVGPWVEQVDEKHFRLTPLFENTAKELFAEPEWLELHRAAAHSFLSLPSVDLPAFASLLTHAFVARDRQSLAAVAMSVFSHEDNTPWPEVSSFISWFGFVKLEQGERLFEGDPFLSVMLRRLQFRVATEIKPELAVKVAKVWEQEVRQLVGGQLPAGTSRMTLLIFLNDVTSADRVPFSIPRAVSYLCENYRALKNVKAFLPEAVGERELLEADYRSLTNARFFLFLAMKRCKGANDVVALLAAIDQLSGEEIEEFWWLLDGHDFEAMLLIDGGWMAESRAEIPNWQVYLEGLTQALAIASKRKATSLIAAIYRARAIVLKEYCSNRTGALESLAEGEKTIGQRHLFLQEYRAKIFFLEERYDEALAIWRNVLPGLEDDQNEGRIYTYKDAGTCAATLGYWSEAADLFLRGAEAARLPLVKLPHEIKYQQDHTLEYSFRAECAFALWKAGEQAASVKEFAWIVDTFTAPPKAEANRKNYLLYKLVGHAITWINLELSGPQTLVEPRPGCFTDYNYGEKIFDELSKLPTPTFAHFWYILAKLENKLVLGDLMFKRFEEEFYKAPNPEVKFGYYDLRIRYSLNSLQAFGLIADYQKLASEFKEMAEQAQIANITWSEATELKQVLFAALAKFLAAGQRQAIPMTQWKQDVDSSDHLKEEVGKWLDLVREYLEVEPYRLKVVLTDSSADNDRRLLTALLLTAADDLDPETLFYANVLLVQSDHDKHWREVYADSLASMISREWQRVAEQQQFALRSPRLNCPAILSACRDASRNGLEKAAAILLSANDAVQTSVAGAILDKLRQLAE